MKLPPDKLFADTEQVQHRPGNSLQPRVSDYSGFNPTVGTIHSTQVVEHVVWESSTMVRYRRAVSCVWMLSVKLSVGAKLEHEAIKNIWLSYTGEN